MSLVNEGNHHNQTAMNPKESASFIASASEHVKINPIGIKKIASEVKAAATIAECKIISIECCLSFADSQGCQGGCF